MAISFTPDQEDFVMKRMATGAYDAPYQVIEDAFRLLGAAEEMSRNRIEEIRKAVALGLEQEAAGQEGPWDIEEIKAESRRRAAQPQEKV